MKQLKFLIFILIAITIFHCYSISTDCDNDNGDDDNNEIIENNGDIIWEPAGNLPYSDLPPWRPWLITIANNGNIWAYNYNYHPELYLSTNNGDTWVMKGNIPMRELSSDGQNLQVNQTNGHLFFSGEYFRLLRSTDDGKNWENIMDSVVIGGFLITASDEIYVGAIKKSFEEREVCVCYYSNDNGNTWMEKSKGLPYLLCPSALEKDGTLYATSINGVYHSTDGGNTWLPSSNYNLYISSLTICDDGSILAMSQDVGILKSTDKGVSWSKVNTDSPIIKGTIIIYNTITKDIFVNNIIGTLHSAKIYRSPNLGKDWVLENMGLPNKEGDYLTVNPKTGQMFIGMSSGVYRTKNYPK